MKLINKIIHIPILNCNIHLFIGDKRYIKETLQKEFGNEEGLELFKEIKLRSPKVKEKHSKLNMIKRTFIYSKDFYV